MKVVFDSGNRTCVAKSKVRKCVSKCEYSFPWCTGPPVLCWLWGGRTVSYLWWPSHQGPLSPTSTLNSHSHRPSSWWHYILVPSVPPSTLYERIRAPFPTMPHCRYDYWGPLLLPASSFVTCSPAGLFSISNLWHVEWTHYVKRTRTVNCVFN